MKHKIIPIPVMPPRWRQDLQTEGEGGGVYKAPAANVEPV